MALFPHFQMNVSCKCAQFSEWVCCEEEGCTDKSWVESDSIVGRLNSGVPVKDGFMFEI